MEFKTFEDSFNYSEFRKKYNKFKFCFRLKKLMNLIFFTVGPILALLLFGLILIVSHSLKTNYSDIYSK